MNIIIMDSWNGKFSSDIRDHWLALGHKVIVNPAWEAMEQADLTFFYQADNTAVEGVIKPHSGKIFVQAVDIEVWAGQANTITWHNVDGVIVMAKHIGKMLNLPFREPPLKEAIIKPGIDVKKWTLIPNKSPGNVRRIAYVVGDRRIWDVKRLDIAFQLLKDLLDNSPYNWQLHIRGTYSSHAQYNAYCQYLEQDLGIGSHVFWYPEKIEDMNSWLENMDYFLLPSTKEAFSYATAEAMCKGIKPIINNWQGSKDTWGKYVCDTYGQMLTEALTGDYSPEEYRSYICKNYDQSRYFQELDTFMGIKGGEA